MAPHPFPRTLMLLGSGELGKEVAIAAQRLGCRVIAVDRYAGAPAMQVADVAEVIAMTDPEALKAVVREAHQRLKRHANPVMSGTIDDLVRIWNDGITELRKQ